MKKTNTILAVMLTLGMMTFYACNQDEMSPEEKEATAHMREAVVEFKGGNDEKAVYFFNDAQIFGDIEKEHGSPVKSVQTMDIKMNDGNFQVKANLLLEDGQEIRKEKTLSMEELHALSSNAEGKTFVWKSDDGTETKRVRMISSEDGETVVDVDEDHVIHIKPDSSDEIIMISSHMDEEMDYKEKIIKVIEEEHGEKVKDINNLNVNVNDGEVSITANVVLESGKKVEKTIKKKEATDGNYQTKMIIEKKKQ